MIIYSYDNVRYRPESFWARSATSKPVSLLLFVDNLTVDVVPSDARLQVSSFCVCRSFIAVLFDVLLWRQIGPVMRWRPVAGFFEELRLLNWWAWIRRMSGEFTALFACRRARFIALPFPFVSWCRVRPSWMRSDSERLASCSGGWTRNIKWTRD